VDEEDTTGTTALASGEAGAGGASSSANGRGEFKRATSARPRRENSADFGPAPMEDDDEGDDDEDHAPRFEYMANEMSTSDHHFDSDDEDDDGGGWLSQSTFALGNPPVSSRHLQGSERRPLGAGGFDDVFTPGAESSRSMADDPFGSADDDGFGPFSDAAAADGSDPFTFSSSFSDEMEDTAFDSFADFGEFSAASPPKDGELTPTAGSWTFASGLSPSPSDDAGSEHLEPQSPEEEKRMP